MKNYSFRSYVESRQADDVALFLFATEIDTDAFCEAVLNLVEREGLNEGVLNELGIRNMLAGISPAAAGLAGLGGVANWAGRGAAQGVGSAGRAVGNAAAADWNQTKQNMAQRLQTGRDLLGKVGNAASSAWDKTGGAAIRGAQAGAQQVGNAVSQGAQAVGNTVQQGAQRVGQAGSSMMNQMGNSYQQAAQAEKLRQSQNAVMALKKQLTGYGYPPDLLDRAVQPLMQALQSDQQANQQGGGFRMGSGTY